MNQEEQEKMELTHEPVRGYPAALYAVVAVALAYIGYVFITSI